jgi:Na+/proline symporter
MLVAFGLIFETLTGTPLIVGIVGGALVIFVYTAVGGLWAVALTDFLQMVILVVGLIMLLIVVLTDVGGWSAIGPRLPADTFRLLPGENTGEQWLNYLRAWTIVGLVDLSAQRRPWCRGPSRPSLSGQRRTHSTLAGSAILYSA